MTLPETFETDRLLFKPATPEHVDVHELYHILSADQGIGYVTEWVVWQPHTDLEQTMDLLGEYKQKWESRDRVTYVMYTKASEQDGGEIAGTTNIRIDWDQRRGRIGVWFRKKYWGRGYSGERAGALLELAFRVLDLDIVVVSHIPGNEKSETAVARYVDRFNGQKEGYIRNGLAGDDGSVYDQVQYSISASEWRTAVGGETSIFDNHMD